MSDHDHATYSERLWPSPTFFLALLLMIPAFTVLFTPFSLRAGVIAGVAAYILVVTIFLIGTRRVEVRDGKLIACRAEIDVALLGTVETLDRQELKVAIGRRLDARAFLCVTGWIHSGVRIPVTDPEDSTPYWIITTRKPETLAAAIREAQGSLASQ